MRERELIGQEQSERENRTDFKLKKKIRRRRKNKLDCNAFARAWTGAEVGALFLGFFFWALLGHFFKFEFPFFVPTV